jgi:hypothetical protein
MSVVVHAQGLTNYIVQNPEVGWRILTHKGDGGKREVRVWVRQNERSDIVTRVKSTPKKKVITRDEPTQHKREGSSGQRVERKCSKRQKE